ncbi:Nucleotide-diphospho-sugar transferase family protein [Euphorbia peplus]|nr:Nucleotide-diphospho-sugar transferase family protein [Euphorbia peplus]
MESSSNNSSLLRNLAGVILIFAGVYYLLLSSASSNPLLFLQRKSCHRQLPPSLNSEKVINFPIDKLQVALEKASMPNKTVIMVIINKAYAEPTTTGKSEIAMLDLFLESFWLGEDTRPLLDHLLLVAVDQIAYDRCIFKRLNCYKLETDGVDFAGEKLYMSQEFIKMMWRRTLLLLDVLKHGYSFIFTDADVMWLRNPFLKLSNNQTIDFQISTDIFNGDISSQDNLINTGFYYIRSNNKTISLFETWYSRKDNSTGKKEQDVLIELMLEGYFRKLNLVPRFLDTVYFSGFCTDSRDVREVVTVHANCCRSIDAKVRDLRGVLRDWIKFKTMIKRYKRLANNGTLPFKWSPHLGCWSSWNQTCS